MPEFGKFTCVKPISNINMHMKSQLGSKKKKVYRLNSECIKFFHPIISELQKSLSEKIILAFVSGLKPSNEVTLCFLIISVTRYFE